MFDQLIDVISKAIYFITLLIRLSFDLARAFYMQIKDYFTAEKKSIIDEVVVITGGAGGIGSALGKNLATLGAKVVLVDYNKEAVERCASELKARGWMVWSFHCDCSDEKQVAKLAEKIFSDKDLGRVDILISCIGLLIPRSILQLTAKDIRMSFDANVISVFWIIKAFLPSMLERNKGHIVAVSSIAGYFGQSFASSYSAAKFAIRGLMESVNWEIFDAKKHGVKTTTLYPYFTQTALLDCCSPSSRFFDNLTVEYTVSHITDYILYEYEEAFIPSFLAMSCLLIKMISPSYVKAVWRNFFNVVYFTDQKPPLLMPSETPRNGWEYIQKTEHGPSYAKMAATMKSADIFSPPKSKVVFPQDSPKINGSPSKSFDSTLPLDSSQTTEAEF